MLYDVLTTLAHTPLDYLGKLCFFNVMLIAYDHVLVVKRQ